MRSTTKRTKSDVSCAPVRRVPESFAAVPFGSILEVVVDTLLKKADAAREGKQALDMRPSTALERPSKHTDQLELRTSLSAHQIGQDRGVSSVPVGGYGGLTRPSTANSSSVPSGGYGGICRTVRACDAL